MNSPTVDYRTPAAAAPRRRNGRFIARAIVFFALISALPCWAVYTWVSTVYNRGHYKTTDGEYVDLKALGNFQIDPVNGTIENVPAMWRALDGKKVVLEGFMYRTTSVAKARQFQFVYNIQKCCFNGPPRVQERVFAQPTGGREVPYIDGADAESRIVGTLHVKVVRDKGGEILSVFTMDVDKAEPKT